MDTERNPGQEKSSEKTERKGEKSPKNVKKKKAERDEDKFETSTKERIYNFFTILILMFTKLSAILLTFSFLGTSRSKKQEKRNRE